MYNINYSQNKNSYGGEYKKFVSQSLERLTAHFGNYSGGGGYQSKPSKRNIDYDLFK